MKDISILGSCVTRDIISASDADDRIADYRARTSLHTLFQPPVLENELPDLSEVESNWQRKMIKYELEKTPLELNESKYLILDFIDDRFQKGLFKGTLVNLSNELTQNILKTEDYVVAFKQGSEEDYAHWEKSCNQFSAWHNDQKVKIILHTSRFAEKHLVDGKLEENRNQHFIRSMNKIISKYEELFLSIVDVAGIVKIDKEFIISDPEHVWGLAPFHYISQYYTNAWIQICKIMKD